MIPDQNKRLAHALARICLGVNIFIHGVARIPHLAEFTAKLEKQFSSTFLPQPAVDASAYVIVFGETIIGFLVLIGWGLRPALIAGTCLMILLQFGTSLVQDWNTAGLQLTYVAFYVGLLATLHYDCCSVDRLISDRQVRGPN